MRTVDMAAARPRAGVALRAEACEQGRHTPGSARCDMSGRAGGG